MWSNYSSTTSVGDSLLKYTLIMEMLKLYRSLSEEQRSGSWTTLESRTEKCECPLSARCMTVCYTSRPLYTSSRFNLTSVLQKNRVILKIINFFRWYIRSYKYKPQINFEEEVQRLHTDLKNRNNSKKNNFLSHT